MNLNISHLFLNLIEFAAMINAMHDLTLMQSLQPNENVVIDMHWTLKAAKSHDQINIENGHVEI